MTQVVSTIKDYKDIPSHVLATIFDYQNSHIVVNAEV